MHRATVIGRHLAEVRHDSRAQHLAPATAAAETPPAIAAALDAHHKRTQSIMAAAGLVDKQLTMAGEQLAYLERPGSGESGTLVCLHGMTQDRLKCAAFVAALNLPDGVRVLVPDALGHGSRQQVAMAEGDQFCGWDYATRAADVVSFLSAAGVHGPVDLLGYSMGGATALQIAADSSAVVRRVCLVAPGLAVTETGFADTLAGKVVYNYRTVAEASEMMQLIGFDQATAEAVAPVEAHARVANTPDPTYWARMWKGGLKDAHLGAQHYLKNAEQLAAKVDGAGTQMAVIQGAADAVIHPMVPQALQRGHPRCELTILDGYGHFGHPTKRKKMLVKPACAIAAKFFGY